MYILTKRENNIESGTFASVNKEGLAVIQFFVKTNSALEHVWHINDVAYIPAIHGFIKSWSTFEHRLHIHDIVKDPGIERSIVVACTIKEAFHTRNMSNIPIV